MSNNKNLNFEIYWVLPCFIVGIFVMGVLIGRNAGNHEIRVEAVAHGVAHWTVNETARTKFEWNQLVSTKKLQNN
jgi:hypothetical protein